MCVNIPGEPQGEGTAGSAEGEWGWMAPQGKRAGRTALRECGIQLPCNLIKV